eukprot:8202981-Prorocentrum_lima.AAC.1
MAIREIYRATLTPTVTPTTHTPLIGTTGPSARGSPFMSDVKYVVKTLKKGGMGGYPRGVTIDRRT